MKAVRLLRSNTLAPWTTGDAGDPLVLEDGEADFVVNELRLATYDAALQRQLDEAYQAATGQPQETEPLAAPDDEASQEFREQLAQSMEQNDELLQRLADNPAEMTMPWANASKAEWTKWAVYKGCERKKAAAMTKAQLMNDYGERL